MEGDSGTKHGHPLFNALQDAIVGQLDILKSQLNHDDEHMSFDGLERQLVVVKDFASALNEHTHSLIAKLRRDRNQMLPIHRIPPELFTHILLQTRQTSDDLDTRTVMSWTTVCSIWRQIIISTPMLWRRIDLADGAILSLVLSRNASVPLEVHWSIKSPDAYWQAASDVNLPPPHGSYRSLAPRCRGLYIHTDFLDDDQSQEILRLYGAHATTIEISTDSILKIILPDGPKLESLVLRCITCSPASWSSPRLAGLQSLYLKSVRGLPTDAEFYHMLASSPSLSTLVLYDVQDNRLSGINHQNFDSTAPLLLLPNLRLLYINGAPTRLYLLIETKLQTPNCDFMHIWFLEEQGIISNLPLFQSLSPFPWASCELQTENVTIAISHHSLRGNFPFEFPEESAGDLVLYARMHVEYGASWKNALSALSSWIPHVHCLKVLYPGPNLTELLENSQIQWQVCALHLEGPIPVVLQAIYTLGERRSRTTFEDTPGTSFPLAQLSYLHIHDFHTIEPLEELVEAIVGLVWAYSSSVAATGAEQAPRFQIIGPERMLDGLCIKDLPPNVVLGEIDDNEEDEEAA